ncbi:hypothetical protein [Bradyrhizobium sp.]|uniref:hypothetical protein n=1 Tax=Bradyrhizobium sp. TaxID=376 RepID=UPI003BAF70AD
MIGHQAKVGAARVVVGKAPSTVSEHENALQLGNAKARDEGAIVAPPPMTARNFSVFGNLRWRLARKRPGDAGLVGQAGAGYLSINSHPPLPAVGRLVLVLPRAFFAICPTILPGGRVSRFRWLHPDLADTD